jgi:hypothetical protein
MTLPITSMSQKFRWQNSRLSINFSNKPHQTIQVSELSSPQTWIPNPDLEFEVHGPSGALPTAQKYPNPPGAGPLFGAPGTMRGGRPVIHEVPNLKEGANGFTWTHKLLGIETIYPPVTWFAGKYHIYWIYTLKKLWWFSGWASIYKVCSIDMFDCRRVYIKLYKHTRLLNHPILWGQMIFRTIFQFEFKEMHFSMKKISCVW